MQNKFLPTLLLFLFTIIQHFTLFAFDTTPRPVTICSGANIIIKGDPVNAVPDRYSWEYAQGGTWVNAPGIYIGSDYLATSLLNLSNFNIVVNLRRKVLTGAISEYDSYYVVTVQPILPILNNSIVSPAVNSFCESGIPAVITGTIPSSGTSSFIFQWQSSVDNINFININDAYDKDYSPGQITSTVYFRRIAITGGCGLASTSNSIKFTVVPVLTDNTIIAPVEVNFCTVGNPALITGNIPAGGNGTYVYQWQKSVDNINYIDIPNTNDKDYDPPSLSAKSYYRRIVTSGTCNAFLVSNIIAIDILPELTAPDVNVKGTTQNSITFKWNVVIGATGYKVSIDNGLTYTDPSAGKTGLIHTISGLKAEQSVTILVKAIGILSCQESENSIAITAQTIKEFGDIYVANAFTPNGDGNNDVVYVRSQTIKTLSFNIYSQWGELIFHSGNPANGWDGTYKGANQPAGVYVYYIKTVMNNNREVNKKGTITLIR